MDPSPRGYVLVDLDEGADRAVALVAHAERSRRDVILLASRTDALRVGLDLIARTPVLGVLPKPPDPRAIAKLLMRPRSPAAAHADVLRLLREPFRRRRGLLQRSVERLRRGWRGRPS